MFSLELHDHTLGFPSIRLVTNYVLHKSKDFTFLNRLQPLFIKFMTYRANCFRTSKLLPCLLVHYAKLSHIFDLITTEPTPNFAPVSVSLSFFCHIPTYPTVLELRKVSRDMSFMRRFDTKKFNDLYRPHTQRGSVFFCRLSFSNYISYSMCCSFSLQECLGYS